MELLGTQHMAGYSIAQLAVYLLRYVGARGELLLTTDFEIEVEFALDSEPTPIIHPNQMEHFRETVRRLAHNPDDEPRFRPHVRGRPDLYRESAEERRKILENPRARRRPAANRPGGQIPRSSDASSEDDAVPPTAGETIYLSSATYTVNENAGSVSITVQCNPKADANLVIGYATANGTAASPADYTGGSGTVTINKNQTSKTFTIPIADDSLYEGNETFTVSITAPAGSTLGSPSTATITIVDNETWPGGTVALSSSAYTVDENGGSVTISVVRSGGKTGAASVQYATSDGTALAGTHYAPVSGTLNWSDQEDGVKTFTVPIFDNSEYTSPDKTFTVALSNVAGAVMGSPASATVTIAENDPDPNLAEYLIITSSALALAFQPLADHRASYNRLAAREITTEYIYANYSGTKPNGGTDNQTRIRNCILDYVNNHGTLYVVLGGDDSVVPDRDTYIAVQGDQLYTSTNCPTDFYYAGLNGNWDDWDADGVYGEADVAGVSSQDEGDLYADVIVGRIPVRSTAQVADYVNKLIAYETSPSPALLRKIILSGIYLWDRYYANDTANFDSTSLYYGTDTRPSDTQNDGHREFRGAAHPTVSDSEMWTRRKYRDKVKGYGWTASTLGLMFDTLTSWDTTAAGDYAASPANLVTRFNEGWNFSINDTHGNTTLISAEGGYFQTGEAASLTGLTAHFRTGACLSGGFDQGEPSLSEAMLRNPNGGALIYIGGARYGWGYSDPAPAANSGYGGATSDYIVDWLTEVFQKKNVRAGSAYYAAKALKASSSLSQPNVYRWIYFSENLQGDPLVPMYGVKAFVRVEVDRQTIEENGGPARHSPSRGLTTRPTV